VHRAVDGHQLLLEPHHALGDVQARAALLVLVQPFGDLADEVQDERRHHHEAGDDGRVGRDLAGDEDPRQRRGRLAQVGLAVLGERDRHQQHLHAQDGDVEVEAHAEQQRPLLEVGRRVEQFVGTQARHVPGGVHLADLAAQIEWYCSHTIAATKQKVFATI